MKKWLFLIALITIVTSIIFFGNQSTPKQEQPEAAIPTPASNINFPNSFGIDVAQNTYLVVFEKVDNAKNLVLIPNFSQRRLAKEIVSSNNCIRAINGGFYTKTYLPLGLFSVSGEKLGDLRKNDLTNGFFLLDSSGLPHIADVAPENLSNIPFIFQSGPLIKNNGALQKLSIVNDKPARRMFLAIDENGQVMFFSVFDEKNTLNGPYLEHLPEIVKQIEQKIKINLINVLNLDGGTASTFWSKDASLEETALVGSILCEKGGSASG